MTEGVPTPFTPEGVPTDEFAALLGKGRERGHLGPDDLMDILQSVELSPQLIDAVVNRVRAEGIEWLEENPYDAAKADPAASGRHAADSSEAVPDPPIMQM